MDFLYKYGIELDDIDIYNSIYSDELISHFISSYELVCKNIELFISYGFTDIAYMIQIHMEVFLLDNHYLKKKLDYLLSKYGQSKIVSLLEDNFELF